MKKTTFLPFAVFPCLAMSPSNSDMDIMRQRKLIFHEASKKFNEATESLNYGSPFASPPSPAASRVKRGNGAVFRHSISLRDQLSRLKGSNPDGPSIHPGPPSLSFSSPSPPPSRMGELADDVGSFFGSPCSVCGDRREIGTTGLEATCTGPEINPCT